MSWRLLTVVELDASSDVLVEFDDCHEGVFRSTLMARVSSTAPSPVTSLNVLADKLTVLADRMRKAKPNG